MAEEQDLLAAVVVDSSGHNQMSYVFPAEHVEKHTSTKRKEVMDRVYVPVQAKTGTSKHVTFNKENMLENRAAAPATQSQTRGPGPMPTEVCTRATTITPKFTAQSPPNASSESTRKPTPQALAQTPQQSGPKTPVPIDIRRPKFDRRNDDHIVVDNVMRKPLINRHQVNSQKQTPAVTSSGGIKDVVERRLPAICQSEIMSYT